MRFVWIWILVATTFSAFGQRAEGPRFGAGIIAGVTAAQLRGDESVGFKKPGFTAGLTAITTLNDRTDFMLEILYSQRGSTQSLREGSNNQIQKYFLNYVEVPLLFGMKDWYSNEIDDFRLQFYGGLSYGRLIDGTVNFSAEHRELLTDEVDTPSEIDKDRYIIERNANLNDYAWILGFNYFIDQHWAASFRYTSSFNYIWKLPKDPGPGENFDSLRNFFLTFRMMYVF